MCKNSERGSKAQFFRDHVDQWKVYLKDANPGALEKALNCLEAFLDKIHKSLIVEQQNAILAQLVEKGLGHAKPVIKNKATDCILIMFEVSEDFEVSLETLQELANHKNVKILACGIQAVAILLENFGIKKIKIPDYAELMLKNAQNTNPQCKNAAYDFYKAVYKWIGDAILPQIEDKLKKTQIDDLKKLFEEVKAKNDKTKRLVRSEKAAEEEAKKNAAIDAAMAEETKEEVAIDPLEFAPEKDVISQFDGQWQDETAAIKKWDEKVAKINEIVKACDNVKIKPANTEGISSFLKKELNNSNVNIAMAAIAACTAIAKGMKKDFNSGVKQLTAAILLKFKEKRPLVLEEIGKYGDAVLNCANLEELGPEFIPLITNVAPGVKIGTIKWLEKAALVTYIDVLQNISNELMPQMVKAIDDKDGGVRDAALHCFGILKGRLGETIFVKYAKDVNAQKMSKIDEAATEVKPSKYDRPENWKPPAPKPAKKAPVANDDDEMMSFDEKPKKAPPKGIGQKPPAKKKPAEDEEMVIDSAPAKKPAAAAKAPPQLSSQRPKTAAPASSAGASKGPAAPVIQDEDIGHGCSKEEAIERVEAFFDSNTVKKFEDAKWQEKLLGFEGLQEEIKEKQPDANILEAVAKFTKAKMKDWKESNINCQKAIVALFNFIAQNCEAANKRTFQCGMAFFVDKIGDVKLCAAIKEMLLNASELATPKFIATQVIKYAVQAKAPNNIKESCNILSSICEEFGCGGLPLKETIDFAKVAAAHATPAVRQSAMQLFCEMYKHVGDVIKNFMNDIKESTLKLIDAELAKTSIYAKGEFQKKRSVRGEVEEEKAAGPGKKKQGGDDDLLAGLPREDISKKLNSKLMEQFKHKDWKIRKKAGDDVEAILREAKMRIECNGLNELMDAMKQGMKDPNKAVVKVFIALLGLLAEAIGPAIKQYTKKCLVPMLTNISDKQSLVRADVVAAMNKWSEAIGAENIINQLGPVLAIENPEGRTESFTWIAANKEAIPRADCKELIKPLVSCLTDKSKAIRTSAEEIISEVMPIVGYNEFLAATKDLKQAVQQTLKPILEKLKSSAPPEPAPAQTNNAPARAKSPVPKPVEKKVEEQKQPSGSFAKAAVEKKEAAKRPQTAVPAKPAAQQDEDAPTITVLNKQKRQAADQRNKWPINEVKGDHIEKLQQYCFDAFGQKLHDLMWAKAVDFNKHIKCVEQFEKFIQSQPDQLLEVLDIVLKWANIKLTESSNTQLFISLMDFFGNVMQFMIDNGHLAEDFEMAILLGTLCERAGVNNKNLIVKVRKLIKMCYDVYDFKACYRIIIDTGVKSKNLKSVAENLEEISEFIAAKGIDCCTKKDFAQFLACVDNSDKNVRENSLQVFAEAYKLLGEDVWRLLGKDINPKVKSLMEARFKQVAKTAGAPAAKMAASINSAKGGLSAQKNPLTLTGQKRQSLQSSIGGLKFNKPSDKDKESEQLSRQSLQNSIKGSEQESVNTKMQNFDPFESKSKMGMEEDPFKSKPKMGMDEEGIFKNQVVEDIPMQIEERPVVVEDVEMKVSHQELAESANSLIQPQDAQFKKIGFNEDDALKKVLQDAEENLDMDPALREQKRFILNHIEQLKVGDLLKRVDSLVALNELISAGGGQSEDQLTNEIKKQQKAMIMCCNELISAFTHVMKDIFSYPVNDIPLRFTKYFITIVNKACASKEIMREVSEEQVFGIAQQLLTRLLIENLDKIGQNKEGELILKNLNSSMLRMLENCNHTYIFVVLFTMLKNYKDDTSMPKLAGLIIKCLLKMSKIMDKLIDKIDLSRFLLAIHEYLQVIDHENKTQNDDLGIRIVKTLVNEVVKLKRESIWAAYEVIKSHPRPDNHIMRWIQIIIKSLPVATSSAPADVHIPEDNANSEAKQAQQPAQSRMYIEFEIKKIIQDLKDPSKLEQAIPKLDKFSKQNPSYDFVKNLQKESEDFAKRIMTNLEQYRNGASWGNKSTNEDSMNASGQNAQDKMSQLKQKLNNVNQSIMQSQDLNSSINKQSAFASKMAKFQNRKSEVTNAQPATSRISGVSNAQQNLNTSFSALNNSLSQKWAAINNPSGKKFGGLTGRPQTASTAMLAQTITPGMGGTNALNSSNNKFQSKMQMQGGFANRLQSKASGIQQPTQGVIGQTNAPPQQPSAAVASTPSKIAMNRSNNNAQPISTNSFRSRLQGLGANNTQTTGTPAAATPAAVGAGQNSAASNQDLQKRLADMKAKLQNMKK